jgi:hypothetical protein
VGAAAMAMDQDYQRHLETWIGFTRLVKWGLAVIVIVLIGMALFLL